MADERTLYMLPVTENGEDLNYYCLVDLAPSCKWTLFRNEELLSHGVCKHADIELMLDSLKIDLSLTGDIPEWTSATIQ